MASPSPASVLSGLTFQSPDLVLSSSVLHQYADLLVRTKSKLVAPGVTLEKQIERFLTVLFGAMHYYAPWMRFRLFWSNVMVTWMYGHYNQNNPIPRTENLVDAVLKARGIDVDYNNTKPPAETRLGRLIDHWAVVVRDSPYLPGSISNRHLETSVEYDAFQAALESLKSELRNNTGGIFSQLDFKPDQESQPTAQEGQPTTQESMSSSATSSESPVPGPSTVLELDAAPRHENIPAMCPEEERRATRVWECHDQIEQIDAQIRDCEKLHESLNLRRAQWEEKRDDAMSGFFFRRRLHMCAISLRLLPSGKIADGP